MKERTYLYSFDKSWDREWASTFKTDEWCGYHEAAEKICRENDSDCAEYPDEQAVWILDDEHTVPRRFVVFAEMTRDYSARELLEDNSGHSTARASNAKE